MRSALAALTLGLALSGCAQTDKAPGAPDLTPQQTPTRIISLTGSLSFGDVPVGETIDSPVVIHNDGNSPLTITGMTGPAGYTTSFMSGTIAAGGEQTAMIRFAPFGVRSFDGTLAVAGDHTSGTNTLPISGKGTRAIFTASGIGDAAFDVPLDVKSLSISASYSGFNTQFTVIIRNELLIRISLGTFSQTTKATGESQTGGGGRLEITHAADVVWSMKEVR